MSSKVWRGATARVLQVALGMSRKFTALCGICFALTLARAGYAESHTPAIWYRASDECPSGAEFLARAVGEAPRARLAEAGDHIDFLVTLVIAQGETVGRLERQTEGGTVAIRELRDASCERVADALALSLGLALAPGAAATGSAPGEVAPSLPGGDALPPATAEPDPLPAPTAAPTRERVAEPGRPATRPLGDSGLLARPAWAVGADAGLLFGPAPHPLLFGALFVDLEPALRGVAKRASFRLGALAGASSTDTRVGAVRHWLAAGYGEVCPVRIGSSQLEIEPCFSLQVGATGVSVRAAPRNAGSLLWLAPGAVLRLQLALPARFAFEANAGLSVPLQRNEIDVGSEPLYRAERGVVQLGLGVSWTLP